jgi:hypothetical protein
VFARLHSGCYLALRVSGNAAATLRGSQRWRGSTRSANSERLLREGWRTCLLTCTTKTKQTERQKNKNKNKNMNNIGTGIDKARKLRQHVHAGEKLNRIRRRRSAAHRHIQDFPRWRASPRPSVPVPVPVLVLVLLDVPSKDNLSKHSPPLLVCRYNHHQSPHARCLPFTAPAPSTTRRLRSPCTPNTPDARTPLPSAAIAWDKLSCACACACARACASASACAGTGTGTGAGAGACYNPLQRPARPTHLPRFGAMTGGRP